MVTELLQSPTLSALQNPPSLTLSFPPSTTTNQPSTLSEKETNNRTTLQRKIEAMAVHLSKEAQISVAASSMFPGFRFSPTDEELLSFYLRKKIEGADSCVEVIPEVEISKHEPWDLPAKSVIKSENEWFFFTPRGRKYPNGSQSKRATESGYWKATGKERIVKSGPNVIGTKRTLVFHVGRAPKGERTEWIMHEYCMKDMTQDTLVVCRLRKNSEFRLNDGSSKTHTSAHSRNIPEDGSDHFGLLEGAKVSDGFPKEHSESTNGHFDPRSAGQQIGSGSESDQRIPYSLLDYPRQQGQEDDLFADILNDDIVDLDKSFLPPTPELFPLVSNLSNMDFWSQHWVPNIQASANPVQGSSASRRTRVKQSTPRIFDAHEYCETEGSNGTSSYAVKGYPICLVGLLVDKRVNTWTKLMLLFVMFMYLVLFVLLFRS